MAITRKTLKNITGGVSQQPDHVRKDNQCEEQVNFLSDPVKGLTRRKGTDYIGPVTTDAASPWSTETNSLFNHVIDRQGGEKLLLTIGYPKDDLAPPLSLIDLTTGSAITVTDDNGETITEHAYLSGGGEARDTHPYAAVTISDHTFIVNKTKIPELEDTLSGNLSMHDRDHVKRGLIFIKEGAYNAEYSVEMTDSEGTKRVISYKTSDGVDSAGNSNIPSDECRNDAKTDLIAAALHYALSRETFPGANPGSGGVYWNHDGGYTAANGYPNFPDMTPFFEGELVAGSTTLREGGPGMGGGRLTVMNVHDGVSSNVCNQLERTLPNGRAHTSTGHGSNFSSGYLLLGSINALSGLLQNHNLSWSTTATYKDIALENSANLTQYFDFGSDTLRPPVGNEPSAISVELGITLLQTMDNLAAAINAADDMGVLATVSLQDTGQVYLNVSAKVEGVTLYNWTTTNVQGIVSQAPVSGGHTNLTLAESGVRYPIFFRRQGSVISWHCAFPDKATADASPVSIVVTDSYGDTMTRTVTDVTETFEGLPLVVPHNYLLKVEGNPDSTADDYYVKFKSENIEPDESPHMFRRGTWHSGISYDPLSDRTEVRVNDVGFGTVIKKGWIIELIDTTFGGDVINSFTYKVAETAIASQVTPDLLSVWIEGNVQSIISAYFPDQGTYPHDDYVQFWAVPEPRKPFDRGIWKEAKAPGSKYKLKASTMPHVLTKVSDSSYKLAEANWGEKLVGDDIVDPAPPFVGQAIGDLFFFKSRLGMLAGEHVVMSELDSPYNFWRTTAGQVIATDRIDIASSVNEITRLNYAVPFANQLIVFSDRTQFLINHGQDGLTPMSASLALISRYDNSPLARPQVSNNSIIFAQKRADSSAIYEMYPTGTSSLSFEAKDISEQLSGYIPGEVVQIETSSLASAIVVRVMPLGLSKQDNKLYVYKFYDKGRERVQSSWSTFEFPCHALRAFKFVGEDLYTMECYKPDGWGSFGLNSFEALTHILTKSQLDNTEASSHAVNSFVTLTNVRIADGNNTKIPIPWAMNTLEEPPEGPTLVAFGSDGSLFTIIDQGSTGYIILEGTVADTTPVGLGFLYTSSYTFSDQYIKGANRMQQEIPVTDGRTTVKWCEVYLSDTQHLTANVTYPGLNRDPSTKTYTGTSAGGPVVGNRDSENETLRFGVAARNDSVTITLSNATHKTTTITGASFELMHTSRLSRTN